MESPDKRRVDYDDLHPAIRDKVRQILKQLNDEGFDFGLFEAYRTPRRQDHLYAQGRTRPGDRVTDASAWKSIHQYGLAVDIVLRKNGQWSWSDTGKDARAWDRLHEVGRAHGLKPLSWEKPHLELADTPWQRLFSGRYPPGGDESWADNLEATIASWGPGAPPPPPDILQRPPIRRDGDDKDIPRWSPAEQVPVMSRSANFERAQLVIKRYEGGFVNHPSDPGGATNFGITQRTLESWRRRPVSVGDVRDMSYEEAKDIYLARYWAPLNCDRMPGGIALAVYNISVHSGPATAGKYLQRALNAQGASLEVDGDVGDLTLGALAQADLEDVLDQVLDLYETRLQGHPSFGVFGKGFMNRVAHLRAETKTWLAEDVGRPPVPLPRKPSGEPDMSTQPPDQAEIIRRIVELMALLRRPAPAPMPNPIAQPMASDLERLLPNLITVINLLEGRTDPAKPPLVEGKPLTPVNGALGQTIGNLLDGKKSAIGIIGAVLTQIMPKPIVDVITQVAPAAMVPTTSGPLLAIFLGLAAWGALGKVEKMAVGVPTNK